VHVLRIVAGRGEIMGIQASQKRERKRALE
jgi:hypothetical protein